MISRLRGVLESVSENRVEVAAGEVVYEVLAPSYLERELQRKKGETVELFTQHYLEGGTAGSPLVPRLIGFLSEPDREFFRKLTKVQGMGAKSALKAMAIPPGELARHIETENKAALSDLPGVGRRTAEKMVAELKGKVKEFALESAAAAPEGVTLGDVEEEAAQVLLQVGYKRSEAEILVRRAQKKNPELKTADEIVAAVFRDAGGAKR